MVRKANGRLVPLNDCVIVRYGVSDKIGSIVLPDGSEQRDDRGTVIAVGPGLRRDGGRDELDVNVGDKIMLNFNSYGTGPINLEFDGDNISICRESDILCKVEE